MKTWPVVLLASPLLFGCPAVDPVEDAGTPPPDTCNTKEEAFEGDCVLPLDNSSVISYIGQAGDRDFYGLVMPSTLTPRSLLHVSGEYQAPNTAVNLTVNVVREDGQTSLVRAVDKHGQAPPKPIDLILPFSEAGARLIVLVSDEEANPDRPNFDARQPYAIRAEVVENPDVNEPNDTTPTPITLMAVAGVPTGTQTGYLATTNDVDRFTFTAPAGRKVAYVKLTAPRQNPPPPFRMAFNLLNSAGTSVAEARAENEFTDVNLATARLTQAGTYTVVVQPYRGLNMTQPIAGDLRMQYTLEVRLYDEVDANEPNDTIQTAKAVTVNALGGAARTVTGRLGYVPDPDWYAVDVPASAQHSVLQYKLSAAAGGGRFEPLPGPVDRSLRVFTQVTTGATLPEQVNSCKTDPVVCPKGYDGRNFLVSVVEGFCNSGNPPLCLRADRTEVRAFANLKNFEGSIPIPPHAATVRYFFVVQDSGNNFADDKDYTLSVQWLADADEDARGGDQTVVKNLAEDATASGFPVPPSGVAYEVTGTLSHGYGRLLNNDANDGDGVRAPDDYDAVSTDIDRYQFNLPAVGATDLTWMLQWDVAHGTGSSAPYDLSLELEFCDGRDGGAGACTPVSRGSKGNPLVLAYQPEPLTSWHNAGGLYGPRQPLYEKASSGGETTVTARGYGCFCVEPRFVLGGKFFVKVGALDRERYESTPYTLRTAYTSYPRGYAADGGGSFTCPAAPTDGGAGCQFTKEP